ncbi:hypothetical protein RvY_16692 [Ramazzottius varieornatus]|uniref:Uncharacterized protein n=1 Tax=Ramazzottius varieornatus TaxID=947166 RepID=A0A1D1W3P7_RAMVA|nr:hypothetical protein RvY_16692 [Ramazzottius varieornatus]
MIDVNCMGSIRVVKAFLPLLREARGRLIIMASLAVSTIEPASYRTQIADTKNVVAQLGQYWGSIPASVQHAYGWYYLEALKAHWPKLAETASPHVNEPVDVTMEAVTSSRIKPRYMAASHWARVRGTLVPWLSTRIQDLVFRRYSLDLPKKK